jgi:large subunit ribosomal protein L1
MAKFSKRIKAIREKIEFGKLYHIDEAIKILQSCPAVKFVESVDVSLNLGIDVKKSEQMVRGATVLPNGTGKNVRVAVFAQNEQAEAAKKAGADKVGFEDLAASIKGGEIDFDVVIATPDAMKVVGQLGQILGPKGLMPNPKVGTVSANVAEAVKSAKGGQVRYRTDKSGIVHCSIGKINFTPKALKENFTVLLNDIKKMKPSTSKGIYLKKITLSSTMGPGLAIDQSSIEG